MCFPIGLHKYFLCTNIFCHILLHAQILRTYLLPISVSQFKKKINTLETFENVDRYYYYFLKRCSWPCRSAPTPRPEDCWSGLVPKIERDEDREPWRLPDLRPSLHYLHDRGNSSFYILYIFINKKSIDNFKKKADKGL